MRIVELKEGFEIYGLKTRTNNADEMSGLGKIANLWKEFLNSSDSDINEIYGVYYDYASDLNGEYSLLAGAKSHSSEICEKVEIKSARYAVFNSSSKSTNAAIELWSEIWKFFENSEIKRAYKTDFEKYLNGELEIYISIK